MPCLQRLYHISPVNTTAILCHFLQKTVIYTGLLYFLQKKAREYKFTGVYHKSIFNNSFRQPTEKSGASYLPSSVW